MKTYTLVVNEFGDIFVQFLMKTQSKQQLSWKKHYTFLNYILKIWQIVRYSNYMS